MRPLDPACPAPAWSLHVAGIGASAGGIEAMLTLFASLPVTGRIAYIVAQHMAHDAHSELVVRLLARESALPVKLADEREPLQADIVYVIPASKDGCVQDGFLMLHPPASSNLSTPSANALLSSIGESCGERAIGIVLSGTGSDGREGCRAIRKHGGVTIAQSPEEAKFDGMPSAAIEAGTISHILPLKAIGETLAALCPVGLQAPSSNPLALLTPTAPPPLATSPELPGIDPSDLTELKQLLHHVHEATGIDFSSYKEETLLRRLSKRKAALGMASAEHYLALIKRQPEELKTLQQLFLISVSSLFRDRASFRELERALGAAVAAKPDGDPIRIWVPGCASGDECYSLAIILSELLGEHRARHAIQIIGTDLNPEALATARSGIYRLTALGEVDQALRERYFRVHGQHFEVSATLRQCVSFEQRDVLAGAPSGDLDLVSCRNLLIYMKSQLQDHLVKIFHQALRPQGLLFVGPSESLSFLGNSLFFPLDHYHRIFRRRH